MGLGGCLVASFDDLLLIWPFPVRTGVTIVLERTRETSLSASEMVLRLFSHGAVAMDACFAMDLGRPGTQKGMRTISWTAYAAYPSLRRYCFGLSQPRDLFILPSQ